MTFGNILKRLAGSEIVLPLLENQMRRDEWPLSYDVTIDSSPYYGLNPDGTPDGYFHPSTHSLLGARQLYAMFHPDTRDLVEREPFSMQRAMTLAVGSSLHAVLQTQMQMIGLCSPEDIECEYINVAHHVRGRADMVVHHPSRGPVLCELKSRTNYKFDKTIEPLPEWEAQTSLACDNLSQRYDTDFDFALVIVMETGFPFRMKEIQVPRNDALLKEIYGKFDYVRESIATNTPPMCGCGYLSDRMKSCSARHFCWPKTKKETR